MDIPTLRVHNIFSDLDYTLFDFGTAHAGAIAQIANQFGQDFAQEFSKVFQFVLELVRARNNGSGRLATEEVVFEKMMADFRRIEGVEAPHLWSRELYAAYVFESRKETYTLDTARLVADCYWSAIALEGALYPDAIRMLVRAHELGIPVHLFSGSDSRLRPTEAGWRYDPSHSQYKKLGRIARFQQQDREFSSITIGDPVDKPAHAYYDAMICEAEHELEARIDPETSIAIGDSYENDIAVPMARLGFAAGFLIDRNEADVSQMSENIWRIPSLDCIPLG